MKKKRKAGYYWVKQNVAMFDGDDRKMVKRWVIKEWDGNEWWDGGFNSFDSDFLAIDERRIIRL